MKYLSLFTGIGGFELGIQQAYELQKMGVESKDSTDGKSRASQHRQRPLCIGFSEIDKYATQVYKKHFPEHKNYGDITKIDADMLPDFDLLVGGFPCQSFSIAGKRGGFEDTRGTLFFDIARIIMYKLPRLILLENVKGLLSHDSGQTFRTIISTLTDLGYDLQWQVLNSKNFGVPQNRERVFIVGHLRGTSRPEVFPIQKGNKINDKIQQKQGTERSRASCLNTRYGQRWTDESYIKEKYMMRDGRDNRSCLRAGRTPEIGVKGTSIRRLTPKECERLQGFPDDWTAGVSDTQRYKCCGNAVTVNVIQAIMERLL
jgi:DNA (cytosine-5)-methyltransferase 1